MLMLLAKFPDMGGEEVDIATRRLGRLQQGRVTEQFASRAGSQSAPGWDDHGELIRSHGLTLPHGLYAMLYG
jgi:hypothetical protein